MADLCLQEHHELDNGGKILPSSPRAKIQTVIGIY